MSSANHPNTVRLGIVQMQCSENPDDNMRKALALAVEGPRTEDIEAVHDRLLAAVPDLEETVRVVAGLGIPDFERETEYVSLKHPTEYDLYDGDVFSSDTRASVPVREYRKVTNEFTVPHSTTKWSRWHRDAYAVGALARFNNNFEQLRPEARQAAEEALEIGLIDELVPAGEGMDRAREMAALIGKISPVSVHLGKQIVNSLASDQPASALESIAGGLAALSSDGREGREAFIEKRPPSFKGF